MLRQEIKLKSELIDKVKNCTKTSTIRKGLKPYRTDLCTILIDQYNYGNKVDISINSISIMTLDEIMSDDMLIKTEGCSTSRELRDVLSSIYGVLTMDTIFTVVNFNMII